MKQDDAVASLAGHTKEVTIVKWASPKLLARYNMFIKFISNYVPREKISEMFAKKFCYFVVCFSASYDQSIRIWNVESLTCLYIFNRHYEPVNSISFDPSGRYLVSAALDGLLNIWELQVIYFSRAYFKMKLTVKKIFFPSQKSFIV